jgi:hypothetical protein
VAVGFWVKGCFVVNERVFVRHLKVVGVARNGMLRLEEWECVFAF